MKDEHLYISLKTYKILAAGMLVGLGLLMCLVVISLVISVFLKHPIYSLLMLIFSFFLIAILMLISGIEYLAALILLIYAGAISILLLFVLMMFDMKELYLFDYFDKQVSKSQIIKFFLAGFIIIFFIVGYVYLACYYFPVVVMNMYDND
jgi:NADH:ubiquinone oxidoreductase subunit 6 (subunit J)